MKHNYILKITVLLAILFQNLSCKKQTTNPSQIEADGWATSVTGITELQKLRSKLKEFVKPETIPLELIYGGSSIYRPIKVDPKSTIYIPSDGWLNASGTSVGGNIEANVVYVNTISENILMHMPTQTKSENLVSAGSWDIQFTQNGNPITNNGTGYIQSKLQGKKGLKIYTANDEDGWNLANEVTFNRALRNLYTYGSTAFDTMFSFPLNFKRINVDHPKNGSDLVSVQLPKKFGLTNTQIYIYCKNEYSVVELKPNSTTKKFESFNFFNGTEAVIVCMSKIGETYYYTTQQLTISGKMNVEITPKEINLYEMIHNINSLN